MRNVLCAAILFVFAVSISMADEIRAVITKIDGKKVTFAESKGKGEKGPEKTLSVSDSVKVLKGKYNQETKKLEAGEALANGLQNEALSKIDEKGVRATVITEGDKIVEIRVGGGRKKQN